MRVYIAGPMRGVPGFNYPAFHAATARWRAAGHEVYNPAEADTEAGVTGDVAVSPKMANTLILNGLQRLAECDAIAMLPGWEDSLGALAEISFARALSPPLDIYDAETMCPLSDSLKKDKQGVARVSLACRSLGPHGNC
jgi:hypothetical protein